MIVRTRTGVRVSGALRRDGETKTMGSKQAFVLPVRAYSEKNADGQWDNFDVDVRIWGNHPELEDMFLKGDYIAAEGRGIEDRPGSDGKVYHNLTAEDVIPGGRVILRWMQEQINFCYKMIQEESGAYSNSYEPTLASAEGLSGLATPPLEDADLGRKLDETDQEDLPF